MRVRPSRSMGPGEPDEFESGSEKPIVRRPYRVALALVLATWGYVMLLDLATPGSRNWIADVAHDCWTATVPSCTCAIPFYPSVPSHRTPGRLEHALWALPVNVVLAMVVAFLVQEAVLVAIRIREAE